MVTRALRASERPESRISSAKVKLISMSNSFFYYIKRALLSKTEAIVGGVERIAGTLFDYQQAG